MNSCNGGDGKFLLEMGGSQEWGEWFYNRGDGKFLKSLYIVGIGVQTPLFYEDPPILPTPTPISNFVEPPSTYLSLPTPTPVVLFLWLNG